MFEHENNYWWFVARKKYLEIVLSPDKINSSKIKILDFGCGTGGTSKFLKKYGSVYGVDIDPLAVSYSKKNKINTKLLSNSKLSYTNNYFDIIFLLDVFYHKNFKVKQNLAEIKRVLKKDGKLIITNPTLNFLSGHHDQVVQTHKRYSRIKLKQIINYAGFEVQTAKYIFFFSLPLIMLNRIIVSKIYKRIDSIDPLPVWVNQFLINIIKLEIVLTKVNNPIGSSVLIIAVK